MKRFGDIAALVIAGALIASPAWAARTRAHEAAESAEYGRKAGGMLGRGLINVGTCFMDVLVETVNETKDGPPLIGTLEGVAKGAGCTVLRAGSGVVDVLTCWVPGFNGFPVSDSYDNCLASGSEDAASTSMHSEGETSAGTTWFSPEPAKPAASPAKKWEK